MSPLYVFAVLNAEAAALFDGLENDGAKVGYCFYAKSQQPQTLARGRDPLQALTQVKVLEGWQANFNRDLPDRDQRNQQLAAALDVFNRQVSGAGVDGEEARAAVIESAMPACDTLMARSDLTPQVLEGEPVVEATDYYKKVFFRTYLQGYSVFCEDQVIDPVRFDYVVTEYDVGDPWADPAGRVTQHDVTYVTRRYAERYERFRQGSSGLSSGQVAGAIAGAAVTSEAQLRRRVGDVKRRMEIEFENRRAIRDHLQGRCRSSSVQRVYANLDDLIR